MHLRNSPTLHERKGGAPTRPVAGSLRSEILHFARDDNFFAFELIVEFGVTFALTMTGVCLWPRIYIPVSSAEGP